MNTFEAESLIISSLLDEMGYGGDMIQYRRESYKAVGQFYSDENSYMIVTGSKGEGISRVFESDRDYMLIFRHVTCAEFHSTSENDSNSSVFVLEREHSTPGYALLKRVRRNNRISLPDLLNESLVKLGESVYLSSACLKYNSLQIIMEGLTRLTPNIFFLATLGDCRGPSIPSSYEISNIKEDTVFALECKSLTFFSDYEARERHFDWPSYDLRTAVAGTRIHVVPAGMDNSRFQLLEWRICCTEGEILLIQHLNPCYVKALILLKKIMKLTLKPICKEMTSYVAKNIILWLAEITDSTRASDSKLVVVFQAALKRLKTCIWRNLLPSYMIPQRNIFVGGLTRKSCLCAQIDLLLNEGPGAILRCPTIKHLLQMKYYVPETLRSDLLESREIEIYMIAGTRVFARIFTLNELYNTSAEEIIRRLISSDDYLLLFQRMPETDGDEFTSGLELEAFTEEDVEEAVNNLPHWFDFIDWHCPLLFGI